MQVSGPITSSLYELEGRTILLLGDMHFSRSGDCAHAGTRGTDVVDWLHGALQSGTPDSPVDLYLETKERSSSFVERFLALLGLCSTPGHIHDVIDFFATQRCLASVKRGCTRHYPHARVHYVDPRATRVSDLNRFVQSVQPLVMMANAELPNTRLSAIPASPAVTAALRWIKKRPTAKNVVDAVRANFDALKITKQLGAMDRADRTRLRAWFTSKAAELERGASGVAYTHHAAAMLKAVSARPFTTRDYTALVSSGPHLFKYVLDATLLEMDMYALGRMLRSFQGAPRPMRIILYAGDAHVQNYESGLAALGATRIERGDQTHLRCTTLGQRTLKVFS